MQKQLQDEVNKLREENRSTEAPKIDKINQLELRKKEIITYANNAIHEIQDEIGEE